MNTQDRLQELVNFKESLKQGLLDKGCIDSDTPFTEYSNKLNTAIKGDQEEIDNFISAYPRPTEYSSNTEVIRPYMFFSQTKLAKISFPNAKVVGGYAFYGCDALTEIYLPNVEVVHTKAFAYCDNLEKVILPKAKVLGRGALANCEYLHYVDLPSLTHFTNSTKCLGVTPENILSDENGLGAIFQDSGSGLTIWIPHTVTKLGTNSQNNSSNPFYKCHSLSAIYTDAKQGYTPSDFRAPDGTTRLNWTQYWNYRTTGTTSNKITTYYESTREQFEALNK